MSPLAIILILPKSNILIDLLTKKSWIDMCVDKISSFDKKTFLKKKSIFLPVYTGFI